MTCVVERVRQELPSLTQAAVFEGPPTSLRLFCSIVIEFRFRYFDPSMFTTHRGGALGVSIDRGAIERDSAHRVAIAKESILSYDDREKVYTEGYREQPTPD